jgi:hypothetical protein
MRVGDVAAKNVACVAEIKQTVRKRGVAMSRAISIGTAALIAHSEPGDQV